MHGFVQETMGTQRVGIQLNGVGLGVVQASHRLAVLLEPTDDLHLGRADCVQQTLCDLRRTALVLVGEDTQGTRQIPSLEFCHDAGMQGAHHHCLIKRQFQIVHLLLGCTVKFLLCVQLRHGRSRLSFPSDEVVFEVLEQSGFVSGAQRLIERLGVLATGAGES